MPQSPTDSLKRIVFLTEADRQRLRAMGGEPPDSGRPVASRYRGRPPHDWILVSIATALQDGSSKYLGKYGARTITVAPSTDYSTAATVNDIGVANTTDNILFINLAELGEGAKDVPGIDTSSADRVAWAMPTGVVDDQGREVAVGWCLNSWMCTSP